MHISIAICSGNNIGVNNKKQHIFEQKTLIKLSCTTIHYCTDTNECVEITLSTEVKFWLATYKRKLFQWLFVISCAMQLYNLLISKTILENIPFKISNFRILRNWFCWGIHWKQIQSHYLMSIYFIFIKD